MTAKEKVLQALREYRISEAMKALVLESYMHLIYEDVPDPDPGEGDVLIETAVEPGINYFDTAEVYNDGRSEESPGIALKGIPRNKVLSGGLYDSASGSVGRYLSDFERCSGMAEENETL